MRIKLTTLTKHRYEKNLIFAAVIMAAMSATTVSGQVAVTKQGQLRLGKHQENSAITPGGPGIAVPLSNGAVIGPGSVGKLKVEAEELTLGEGFEVELGGEFEFNPVIERSK